MRLCFRRTAGVRKTGRIFVRRKGREKCDDARQNTVLKIIKKQIFRFLYNTATKKKLYKTDVTYLSKMRFLEDTKKVKKFNTLRRCTNLIFLFLCNALTDFGF